MSHFPLPLDPRPLPPDRPHIAIIGAGPIGLEAALYAARRGYRVSVFERGRVAENIRRWGHVRLFSPFGMNSSEWGRAALRAAGQELPADDALLTGQEFVERYTQRLRYLHELRACVFEQTSVVSVGRAGWLKSDLVLERANRPLRLLLDGPDCERAIEADVVLDCSGTYGHHNWLGDGGIPCPGERDAADRISYLLPLPAQLGQYAGVEHVLVVGSGYSAATSILSLSALDDLSDPELILSAVYWVTRSPDSEVPIARIAGDLLGERDFIAHEANSRALEKDGLVEWLPGHIVLEMKQEDHTGRLHVALQNVVSGARRTIIVSRIIANVGYRPDRTLYEELHVHECYATQGPMKLAAKLLGETSSDCLDQTSHGADVLRNPEPNFFILGMKSYGRRSDFLIRVGLRQITEVFELMERELFAPGKPGGSSGASGPRLRL